MYPPGQRFLLISRKWDHHTPPAKQATSALLRNDICGWRRARTTALTTPLLCTRTSCWSVPRRLKRTSIARGQSKAKKAPARAWNQGTAFRPSCASISPERARRRNPWRRASVLRFARAHEGAIRAGCSPAESILEILMIQPPTPRDLSLRKRRGLAVAWTANR